MKKNVSFENRVWLLLTIVLVIVTASGFFVYKSLSKIVNEITEEARPDETVILMKEMLYDITDAENSVKSYSLTNETPYLDAFNKKFLSVNEKIVRLHDLTNQTEHNNNVDSLDKLIAQKFTILEDLLILHSQSRVGSALDKVVSKIQSTSNQDKQKVEDVKENNSTSVKVKDDNQKEEQAVVNNEEEKEKFFKRLLNKRKNDKETTVEEKETIVENKEESKPLESEEKEEKQNNKADQLTFEKINQQVSQIKYEEALIDQSLKEQELLLIQEDKNVMDKIMIIFNQMEADETLSMEEKLNLAETQSGKTKVLIAIFCLVACVLLFFAGYAVNTYVKKNDAYKKALRSAKFETDQKNREITDSIIYAQRIQEAILPDMNKMKDYLNEAFILYKPKDIVAGDFYWTVKVDDKVFFAVADCTGHGVPGAMVSVVCNNALNRSVREFGLKKPAEILEKCRELVIETFAAGNHNVNDGMDIALCMLELNSGRLEYSGANNSLYIVKNGILQEVVADKQPIGKYQHQEAFTNHQMTLEKGNVIYLFSDGMADQFGGPKGKKFKYKAFQELLVSNAKNEMHLQQRNIEYAFENWRGDLEQVDDVCVIGVRV